MARSEYETVSVTFLRFTPKAVVVRFPDQDDLDDEEFMIPQSCIEGGDDLDGEETELNIARWWLAKNGIDY